MQLNDLLGLYRDDPRTEKIALAVGAEQPQQLHLEGMVGSSPAFLAAATWMKAPAHHLFILANKEQAAFFQNDLSNLLEKKDILFFPDSFKKPGYFDEINRSNVLLRTEMVSRLLTSQTTGELMVTYPEALFEKLVDTKVLAENTIHMKVAEKLNIDFIVEVLVEYGFDHVDFVYEPGQFSIRGGIIDIFSFGNENPYRVELFDDEVESIRTFDPLNQLSKKKISQVTIVPNIQTQFESKEKVSLLKMIPEKTLIWMEDPEAVKDALMKCEEKLANLDEYLKDAVIEQDNPISEGQLEGSFMKSGDVVAELSAFSLISFGENPLPSAESITYRFEPPPSFNKNFDLIIRDLKQKEKDKCLTFIFSDSKRQFKRFGAIFADLNADLKYETINIAIFEGFVDPDLKLACYTDHQIFGRYYKYKVKQGFARKDALSIRLIRELRPGDFVTHIDHGIGKYSGLEKIEVNGKTQETVRILYKDNDILYVNINSLHKISKYVGREGTKPRVNKLGSDAWSRVKRKAKKKIKDIAADLIKLYAERKQAKGFAYSPDSYLQTELEASFIFEDTPDQMTTTLAVKEDMEGDAPMDRLVCGDVGFGKTEIAIRAAAKAVADSKQVAILVPTTILALQHYQTFSERLKDFPAEVDYLNRFKTAKEKRITLERLEKGQVDIIIGTHGLASNKVKFKDLGLLIIDEEQKFGVAAKEKLRSFKVNVDTLTLTATPIPRTLQFSLMNARDLSTITTAPPNRQPVTTELMTFKGEKIRDAINYEIYRGGQVFFVHNRVKDIEEIAVMIKKYCPDIDVGIAHGQLDNKLLEEKMMKFIKRQYDVLVCTNIVESGLDIPNANTIIINNAHHFGLSDLHQLRGRVGRSNKKAFCYLISPPIHGLPQDSRKRLKTIKQFADLGSGFNIAMKDLDIRGAGNLLGGEQSGFISDIGFETYQKILNEAIQELRENEFKDVFKGQIIKQGSFVQDCQIDTDLELLIPDNYVNNVTERLNLYTLLNRVKDEEELAGYAKKMGDRFGKLPREVKELFNGVRLRWVATKLGFEKINIKNRKLRCYFVENQESPYYESAIFQGILKYILTKPKVFQVKQTNKYLILIVEEVGGMKKATELLREIDQHVQSQEAATSPS